jgi:hypothetical protein
MPRRRHAAVTALSLLAVVTGGAPLAAGRRADDCLVGWRIGAEPAAHPRSRRVACRDGDPACDGDGAADGVCTIAAAVCGALPGCEGREIAGVEVTGAAVDVAEPGEGCAAAPVTLRSGRRATLVATATARDGGRDRDRLRLRCARSRGMRAIVLTTDFETGILATLPTSNPRRVTHPDTPVHADAVLRTVGGRPVVVNRFLGDNVQVLDPARGFATRLQCSTGVGSNPHDIVAVAPDKAYVTRYGRAELWVVDPSASSCDRFRRGAIDLSAFADADGLPEMSQMVLAEGRVFVSVQRLDRTRGFAPTGPSRLVVIDPASDTVLESIRLTGANAFGDASGIAREPGSGRLVVGTPGDIYRVGDGGLERVDPVTLTAEGRFFVTEDTLGGNVTDFVLVSPGKAYAVVQTGDLRNRLVAFDPGGATPPREVLVREGFLPDIVLGPDGLLWVADMSQPAPGLRRVDPQTDRLLPPRVIDLGLPPFSIGFAR